MLFLLRPRSLRPRIIFLAQDYHPSIVRTKQRLCERYWWPSMNCEVEAQVNNCQSDKSTITQKPPLQLVSYRVGPTKQVGIDIAGSFRKMPQDSRFAITAVEQYSNEPEVEFVYQVTTKVIMRFLLKIFIIKEYPEIILSDHVPEFESHLLKSFLQERGANH